MQEKLTRKEFLSLLGTPFRMFARATRALERRFEASQMTNVEISTKTPLGIALLLGLVPLGLGFLIRLLIGVATGARHSFREGEAYFFERWVQGDGNGVFEVGPVLYHAFEFSGTLMIWGGLAFFLVWVFLVVRSLRS